MWTTVDIWLGSHSLRAMHVLALHVVFPTGVVSCVVLKSTCSSKCVREAVQLQVDSKSAVILSPVSEAASLRAGAGG